MERPTQEQLRDWMAELGLDEVTPHTVILVRDVTMPAGVQFPGWAVLLYEGDMYAWPCSTLPSANELLRELRHKDGTAIIQANVVHKACWQWGFHNPSRFGETRPCLRQVDTISVHRDDDGDTIPEWTRSSKAWENGRGLNLHDWRGSSAGCPTMLQEDLDKLLGMVIRLQAFTNFPKRWDLLVLEPLLTCES